MAHIIIIITLTVHRLFFPPQHLRFVGSSVCRAMVHVQFKHLRRLIKKSHQIPCLQNEEELTQNGLESARFNIASACTRHTASPFNFFPYEHLNLKLLFYWKKIREPILVARPHLPMEGSALFLNCFC